MLRLNLLLPASTKPRVATINASQSWTKSWSKTSQMRPRPLWLQTCNLLRAKLIKQLTPTNSCLRKHLIILTHWRSWLNCWGEPVASRRSTNTFRQQRKYARDLTWLVLLSAKVLVISSRTHQWKHLRNWMLLDKTIHLDNKQPYVWLKFTWIQDKKCNTLSLKTSKAIKINNNILRQHPTSLLQEN